MITSRGCPYTCSFCDRTVFERLYKTNSADYIYRHMKYLRDRFGVHHVNIYDDLFTAKKQRVFDLCQLLIDKPLGMQFNCAIRTGHTSDEMLVQLKKAGALMVSMGIESADPEMMARHKAGVTLDAVRDTVRQIHAAGLRAKGLFIFGMPGETPETVKTTSDFILSLDLDEMNMTKFSPLHGAPIWDECASGTSGDLIEDWRLMNCLNFVYLPEGFLRAKKWTPSTTGTCAASTTARATGGVLPAACGNTAGACGTSSATCRKPSPLRAISAPIRRRSKPPNAISPATHASRSGCNPCCRKTCRSTTASPCPANACRAARSCCRWRRQRRDARRTPHMATQNESPETNACS